MTEQCETNRLILRVLGEDSAEKILTFYRENSAHFDPHELTRPYNFYTLEYMRMMCNWEQSEMQAGRTLRYYLFEKSNPETIIGTVNFSDIQGGVFSKASIGYKIDHRYINRGFAFEACKKALEIIFHERDMHRIEALILPDNLPSVKVAKNLGFLYEGTERETAFVNGRWADMLLYSLLKSDFEKPKFEKI